MRARYPDQEGHVDRDGVKIHYEVFGSGERTIFFLPPWAIVHSRIWKAQVPYLARHFRVLTHDPRGNGISAAVFIAPSVPLGEDHPLESAVNAAFDQEQETY